MGIKGKKIKMKVVYSKDIHSKKKYQQTEKGIGDEGEDEREGVKGEE